jgi:hypothetical protein
MRKARSNTADASTTKQFQIKLMHVQTDISAKELQCFAEQDG